MEIAPGHLGTAKRITAEALEMASPCAGNWVWGGQAGTVSQGSLSVCASPACLAGTGGMAGKSLCLKEQGKYLHQSSLEIKEFGYLKNNVLYSTYDWSIL